MVTIKQQKVITQTPSRRRCKCKALMIKENLNTYYCPKCDRLLYCTLSGDWGWYKFEEMESK